MVDNIKIFDININNFNIFKATAEELVAKALDEAGLVRSTTLINNIPASELCKSFDIKKENFNESTKIGNLLVKNNVITQAQLQEALEYQKANPHIKIGTVLINFKYCTVEDIEKFLIAQIQIRKDITELDKYETKLARIKSKLYGYNVTSD